MELRRWWRLAWARYSTPEVGLRLHFVAENLASEIRARTARFSQLDFCDASHCGRPPFNQYLRLNDLAIARKLKAKVLDCPNV